MTLFRNIRIGTRLGAAFAFLLALLAIIASIGAYTIHRVHGALVHMYEDNVRPIELIGEVTGLVQRNRVLVMDMMLHPEAANVDKRNAELESNLQVIGARWRQYIESDLEPEERRLAEAFSAANDRLVKDGLLAARDALRAGKRDDADRLYTDKISPLAAPAGKALTELAAMLRKQGEEAKAEAERIDDRSYWIIGFATGLALLTGGLLSWSLARSITVPLTEARDAAQRVAAGDLSAMPEARSGDETGQLISALGRMRANLTGIVSGVREGAESVATACAQIAQGNQDLSARTERQASALQQTAATMDELGSTVRNNADNARQANQLAQSASEVAVRGGAVVGEVVTTMRAIDDSSKRIADIIGTIDGIAFQTNILALNAAVEAARAGEQGRGFAVVAGEVRSLAQRSADAAKEIKSLIGASVERVDQGNTLVGQAGQTMQEVVTSIRRVADIVAEIASASTEQSSGVVQVGQAVTQMDQATQQNAALVEQSAAAAESLKQQAAQLVQAVGVFRVA